MAAGRSRRRCIISGRIIYIFGIPERLRTLRYAIFTGGVVKATGICSACSLRKRRCCEETLSVKACGFDSSPERGSFLPSTGQRK